MWVHPHLRGDDLEVITTEGTTNIGSPPRA